MRCTDLLFCSIILAYREEGIPDQFHSDLVYIDEQRAWYQCLAGAKYVHDTTELE